MENKLQTSLPFEPVNGTIIVEVIIEDTTEGGIVLPQTVQDKMSRDVTSLKGIKWFKVLGIAKDLSKLAEENGHILPKVGQYVALKDGHVQAFKFNKENLYGHIEWYQVMIIRD